MKNKTIKLWNEDYKDGLKMKNKTTTGNSVDKQMGAFDTHSGQARIKEYMIVCVIENIKYMEEQINSLARMGWKITSSFSRDELFLHISYVKAYIILERYIENVKQ